MGSQRVRHDSVTKQQQQVEGEGTWWRASLGCADEHILHRAETAWTQPEEGAGLEKLMVASSPAAKDKEDDLRGEKSLEWGGLLWAVRV